MYAKLSYKFSPVKLVWNEIDRKVRSELLKKKQELFTHCLEFISTNIHFQVTWKDA